MYDVFIYFSNKYAKISNSCNAYVFCRKIYITLKSLNQSIYGEDIAKEYSVRGSCVGYPN